MGEEWNAEREARRLLAELVGERGLDKIAEQSRADVIAALIDAYSNQWPTSAESASSATALKLPQIATLQSPVEP